MPLSFPHDYRLPAQNIGSEGSKDVNNGNILQRAKRNKKIKKQHGLATLAELPWPKAPEWSAKRLSTRAIEVFPHPTK
ncbi:hypothetical protein TNCV_3887261 [Trichonephila clavipes]|nr:hypothetical protein TNCV_3887261 [Trichonephila clavipes]